MAVTKGANPYVDAKRMAKHAAWLAKSEAEKEEFTTISPDDDDFFPYRQIDVPQKPGHCW